SMTTWDGASHGLAFIPGSNENSLETLDGTGYRVDVSNFDQYGVPLNAIVTDRHGTQFQQVFSGGRCSTPSFESVLRPGHFAIQYDNWTHGPQNCEQRSNTQQLIDSNGNQIGYSPLVTSTDTLGRPSW